MDRDHPPSDNVNRRGRDAGSTDDEAETRSGAGDEPRRDATSDLGDDVRSRLARDLPNVEPASAEEPTPAADAEAFLKRAFPEGDEGTSSRPTPTGDMPLYRSDVAEAMQSPDAVDTLLALGRGCAAEGDWRGVEGVLDALSVVDPTRQDHVRAVGVYHAVQLGQPDIGRDLARGMRPGRAQDGWTRYAQGDMVLREHHVGRWDSLWGISEQHLGDGRRWREICDINVGRPQADGGHLTAEARDIRRGWILVLPPDAQRGG